MERNNKRNTRIKISFGIRKGLKKVLLGKLVWIQERRKYTILTEAFFVPFSKPVLARNFPFSIYPAYKPTTKRARLAYQAYVWDTEIGKPFSPPNRGLSCETWKLFLLLIFFVILFTALWIHNIITFPPHYCLVLTLMSMEFMELGHV